MFRTSILIVFVIIVLVVGSEIVEHRSTLPIHGLWGVDKKTHSRLPFISVEVIVTLFPLRLERIEITHSTPLDSL